MLQLAFERRSRSQLSWERERGTGKGMIQRRHRGIAGVNGRLANCK